MFTVAELNDGQTATLNLQVISARKIPIRTRMKSILAVSCSDATGSISLKWFNSPPGMEKSFVPGRSITITGTVKKYMGRPEILHPEVTWKTEDLFSEAVKEDYNAGRVVPIYTEIEGVNTRILRKVLWEAIQKYSHLLNEDLPERFIGKLGFPSLAEAIRFIHFPPGDMTFSMENLAQFRTPSHCRLIYEEFFKFEFLILKQRLNAEKLRATSLGAAAAKDALAIFEKKLPFQLTGNQKKATGEILSDLAQPHPMNRLVQGDVGSGKTAVTLLAAACVVHAGHQSVLMAPTEILAEQHERSARALFGDLLEIRMLTGKTPNEERKRLLADLAAGNPLLLIGTHAILEDPVEFKSLILIAIDEQQRFGVEQRRTLRNKGLIPDPATGKNSFPHILVLTATPIPRTLALTAYGDLAVSLIKEMPPGRMPIKTTIVKDSERLRAYEKIRTELKAGRQAYFIYPLVNESEAEGFTELRAATIEAERLQKEVFPEFKVGILHGQMKAEEKNLVMQAFKRGENHILVSTTVVEVGVDVPNATVMVVEHSERFGLSQLHQLRGRVGRGKHSSFCFYFASHNATSNSDSASFARLEVLERTQDGFEIAEADLEIRGPGEFLGTRQAGSLPFRLASLIRDRDWLVTAREDAMTLLKEDAELQDPTHLRLREYYLREGSLQSERLKTS